MKMVGIILAGGAAKTNLERQVAAASLPIAARYRSVDFPLSNMSNSGISNVAVVTQFSSRTLNKHLKSASWWGFGRKHGGISMISPMVTREKQDWYYGTIDAMADTIDFLNDCHEPYVAIASGDGIYKIDFNKVLDLHIEKEADVTCVCVKVPERLDAGRFGNVILSDSQKIERFLEKPNEMGIAVPNDGSAIISCGVYIMRRRNFISLISEASKEGKKDFVKDILVPLAEQGKAFAYIHDGYWNNISTEEGFYQTNMDFLKEEVRKEFFETDPQIYSKVKDNPPAKYYSGAEVSGSIIAGGAVIDGKVENSVIFSGAVIKKGAYVKDSIILRNVVVNENEVVTGKILE